MTLILSCVTENAGYQVSDRRLTTTDDPAKLYCSKTNKMVFVDDFAFGYTGCSKIGGLDADQWLTQMLQSTSGQDASVMFEHIRARATDVFRGSRRVHAFQAVGWFQTAPNTPVRPGIVMIENFYNPNTKIWSKKPRERFECSILLPKLRTKEIFLTAVGTRFHRDEERAVYRLVRACARLSEPIRWQ